MRSGVLILLGLVLAGCQHISLSELLETSRWPAHKWKGRWGGVEGTFVDIQPQANNCQVSFQTLDGFTTYACTLRPDAIVFIRNGQIEALRHGTGEDTGVKGLQDQENCLVVRIGEGYCRR